MKMSLCIPMYNENSIIADTARTLSDYMAANFDDYEIIFSNDGSTDGCDRTVAELSLPHVRVVGYPHNQGKGCAVRTALLAAEGDFVMFTDADLAYGTDVIRRVYDTFLSEAEKNGRYPDMIIGSRNLSEDGYEGYTFIRRLASKIYIKVLCFGMAMVVDRAIGDADELARFIEARTGMAVREVSVVRLDYVNDSTTVDVRCGGKAAVESARPRNLRAA